MLWTDFDYGWEAYHKGEVRDPRRGEHWTEGFWAAEAEAKRRAALSDGGEEKT